jgi:N-acetylglucosaminyldiphosphoundecaprenol N-acetyl-beta-D-mannosaminyltransferase
MLQKPRRYTILNIWVDDVSKTTALNLAAEFLQRGTRPHTVFAANPEKNYSAPLDPELYQTLANSDLLLPDGIGMVLAARLLHGVKISRVPGVEFMQDICRLAAAHNYAIFLYGGREEVNQHASELLRRRYPSLRIAGRAHGYLPLAAMPNLIDDINASRADILFLALGSPKQEKWFASYGHALKTVRLVQGIGGTLDVITGRVPRAPERFQKLGLEWLYRLWCEPRRLRRQLILPFFAFQVLMAKLSLR